MDSATFRGVADFKKYIAQFHFIYLLYLRYTPISHNETL